jgi:SEC-C motif-containing protein
MPVGRNDPCPCGSGKKYKRCCGATTPLVQVSAPRVTAGQRRQCGTCTVCCGGWIEATIYGHEMKPGHPCRFRGDGCCTIYPRRPDFCRTFTCGWLQPGSPFPEDFKPDRLGVLIVPIQWRGRTAYILRSAGRDPDEATLQWMREFSVGTGCPFFYEQGGERFGFGPQEFQVEMLEKFERGESLW